MADDTTLNTGSGGDVIRTEQHGGAGPKTPVSLIDVGGTGASEAIVGDAGVFLPIEGAAAENAAAAGNPILVGGRYDTTPRTLGDTDAGAIALTSQGSVFIEQTTDLAIVNGAGTISIDDGGNVITVDGSVTVTGSVSVTGTLPAGDNNIGNVDIVTTPGDGQVGVAHGASQMGFRVLGSDGAIDREISVTSLGHVNIADGGNVITVDGTGSFAVQASQSGTWNVANTGTFAVQAAQSGTWTVQPGNTQNTTPWLTAPATRTSGGPTTFHLVSAASTNATSIKASAGQVYGWYIYNTNASMRKVAFHNTAGTPTAGASVYFSLCIPGSSGANVFLPHGIPFSTGIAITTVTGAADTDATAVAANDLVINIWRA